MYIYICNSQLIVIFNFTFSEHSSKSLIVRLDSIIIQQNNITLMNLPEYKDENCLFLSNFYYRVSD
jgi:hypothetical protein